MLAPCKMLIATTNEGKVREIRLALADAPVELVTLDQALGAGHSALEPPEETGVTFAENAFLKADYYAASTGMTTVAEDSGLVIDALDGRPGVESARYPGDTYAEKFRNLHRELAGHARPWQARYVCSVAVVDGRRAPRPTPHATPALFTCEATVEGEIAEAPVGTNGFGYDPIFFYPPYGTTLGNVDDARKLAVSHRGHAFRKLRAWLASNPGVLES